MGVKQTKPSQPVFILGILPRSGTNYLAALLNLHPEVAMPQPIREDWLLAEACHLVAYVQAVNRRWTKDPRWGVSDEVEPELSRLLGYSLLSFLDARSNGQRLLTKTPSVQNLSHFFSFFPQAQLLILIRDGRDVVESSTRSFGWSREQVTRHWAQAARMILNFEQAHQQFQQQYLRVRYEDLVCQQKEEITNILTFLNLDTASYDYEAAANLKVYGSSTFHGQAQVLNWQGIPKTEAFNPLQRWRNWSRAQHERYNWLAGQPSRRLGYDLQTYSGQALFWQLYNRLQDLRFRKKQKTNQNIL